MTGEERVMTMVERRERESKGSCSKECGSKAWDGRDNKKGKGKHTNDFDKNITDRKQRGWGEQWAREQTEKRREQHIYTTKVENVQAIERK